MLKWDFDKHDEYADKMRPILDGLCDGEMWYLLTWLAHRFLIPCWMDREDVANQVGCPVAEGEFREFHRFVWKYGDEAAGDLICEYWEAWRASGQYADWLRDMTEDTGGSPDGSNG